MNMLLNSNYSEGIKIYLWFSNLFENTRTKWA